MKKKIYVNKINKNIDNNQGYCEVSNNVINENIDNKLSVSDKLDKLFNTNGYVFNKEIKIVTNDKIYNTKIAGKMGNHIITMDKDVICIKTIKDIIF